MAEFAEIVPRRLWQVTNLLTADQTAQILAVDWLALPWTRSPQQRTWPRREIARDCDVIQLPKAWHDQQLATINRAAGTEFANARGHFWVDLPGFTVPMHTDGHLSNSLQMYWIAPDHTYGTGFYQHKRSDTLIHQFTSRPNSGYLMLNHANADGSQPLQWHAMLNTVPQGHIRVTSYWHFS